MLIVPTDVLRFFTFCKKAHFLFGGVMASEKYRRKICIVLLQKKYEDLKANGKKRYPRKSDFSDREVVAIKAFLGPWPRALEKAGIKPPRNDDRLEKNRQKRIRAKRAKIKAIKDRVISEDEQ